VAMPMNDDLKIILERIELNFKRRPQTEYYLQVVNDTYDRTYNFFINIQPKNKRRHSIPLHTINNYKLSYLEKIISKILSKYHFTIMYDGFTGLKWPYKQELIQRRRHFDE
jgi:hypothetical protein